MEKDYPTTITTTATPSVDGLRSYRFKLRHLQHIRFKIHNIKSCPSGVETGGWWNENARGRTLGAKLDGMDGVGIRGAHLSLGRRRRRLNVYGLLKYYYLSVFIIMHCFNYLIIILYFDNVKGMEIFS